MIRSIRIKDARTEKAKLTFLSSFLAGSTEDGEKSTVLFKDSTCKVNTHSQVFTARWTLLYQGLNFHQESNRVALKREPAQSWRSQRQTSLGGWRTIMQFWMASTRTLTITVWVTTTWSPWRLCCPRMKLTCFWTTWTLKGIRTTPTPGQGLHTAKRTVRFTHYFTHSMRNG